MIWLAEVTWYCFDRIVVEIARAPSVITKTSARCTTSLSNVLKGTFFAVNEVYDVRGCAREVLFYCTLFSGGCEGKGCRAIFNVNTGFTAMFGVASICTSGWMDSVFSDWLS